ncbi:hypothetical protein FXF61_08710 [Pseudomonas sp. C27(2019)]|uniref:hypothetical protein n=1 Tax=Pseudomonas sp. C27(2019) TaxID=2604941 RepID=UPI001246898A|nr:hypothetical protein [Pseudomonas sp. C27(2019)]QEY59238.1 hypothetical protein FXF61_08710 [Pseudomonas sp. C27(2019)]
MALHIDDFYKDTAKGLLILYQAFPKKSTLYMDDLIGYLEPDELGLPSDRQQRCLSGFLWLAEEGYLRYQSVIRFEALDQIELSEKAFLRLSSTVDPVPDVIQSAPQSVRRVQGSLANQLREALHAEHSERVIELMQLFFKR